MRSASFRSIASATCFVVTAAVLGSCTLTGPLDGYSGGEPPDASGSDVFVPCGTPGYADCDGKTETGCETPIDNDPNNCGACGKTCTADAGETPSCSNQMCGTGNCPGGKADCDNNTANGCETDIATQVSHCGSCTKVCNLANATPKCTGGVCLVDKCTAGFLDCDSKPDTGCETNGTNSVQNCGVCKHVCSGGPNATAACTNSACALLCNSGFDDCDKQAANGCEINLNTDLSHCGTCATACSTVGGTPSCTAGKCSIKCSTGNADCDKKVETGCEANLDADPQNCGTCGTVCQAPSNATAICTTSGCDWKCNVGSGDCNGTTTDGCETSVKDNQKNCGACGHDCIDTACAASKCQAVPVSPNLNRPTAIVTDSASVFWTDIYDDALLKAPKTGGAPTSLANFGAGTSLATDGISVFWSTGVNIAKIPVAGGITTVLVSGQADVNALAVDNDSVYWLKAGTWNGSTYNKDGSVMKVAMTGGATTVLVAGQNLPVAIAVDGSTVYWTNQGTANDGAVYKMPKTGGAPVQVASAQKLPCGMAINASVIYWVTNCLWDKTKPGSQTLMKAPKSGGAATSLIETQDISSNIVADDSFVYWSFTGFDNLLATGTVSKVSVNGGDPIVLATAQNHPRGIALDSQRIYWANGGTEAQPPPGDGAIMKVAK